MKVITAILCIFIQLFNSSCSLEFYWNIPSFMCKKYEIDMTQYVPNFGININGDDKFHGEKISIMYDPGMFPALSTKNERRNGGVPQAGNLSQHLEVFKVHVDEMVKDPNNKGLVIIDFESWRPIYRQNFGALAPYKELSVKLEKERQPFYWTKAAIEAEAERRFESAGREFVEETIKLGKNLRPSSRWGYYAFPYCFNKGKISSCTKEIRNENDRMGWMFFHEDIVLPSVYLQETLTFTEKTNTVKGRISEAIRVSKAFTANKKPVYVYVRYVYTDSLKFISDKDFLMILQLSKDLKADGIILWGSSFDLNTKRKCENFKKFFLSSMGPNVQNFVQVQE